MSANLKDVLGALGEISLRSTNVIHLFETHDADAIAKYFVALSEATMTCAQYKDRSSGVQATVNVLHTNLQRLEQVANYARVAINLRSAAGKEGVAVHPQLHEVVTLHIYEFYSQLVQFNYNCGYLSRQIMQEDRDG